MPMLPVIAVLAVVVGMLAAIGARSPAPQAQHGQPTKQAASQVAAATPAATAATAPQPVTQVQGSTAGAAATPAATAASFTAEQKKSIEQIVKDFLINNPEVLAEAQGMYEQKQELARAETMKKAMAELAPQLFRSTTAPVAGNPKGDVTVVEFFDYNCGYCKKALPDLASAVAKDKNIKVVMKEFPILSKGSEEASKVALAAKMQNKYWEFHSAMMETPGQANEAVALKVAEKLGLNIAKLKVEIRSAPGTNEPSGLLRLWSAMYWQTGACGRLLHPAR